MNTSTNPTPTRPSVWLTLQAHDAPALIEFYTQAFGFELRARYDEEGTDRVAHAELCWPEGSGGLMMGSHKPAGEWTTQPGTAAAYVVVSDPAVLRQRIVDHGGARSVGELNEKDYGSSDFAVVDPEGNQWSFGTYAGAA
ncbi:MAG: VOC family protein [Microlunatus sp.]|nr:VOC family protein [Microlunatus sp.]MDN5769523.1 VOC family protein [Microlunatus sp.]MDN5803909.1 VOC family protein [Microlunatus sp.]